MPLYADHQVVYESSYKEGEDDLAEVTSVKVAAKDFVVTDTHNNWTAYKVAGDDRFFGLDGQPADVPAGYVAVLDGGTHQGQKTYKAMKVVSANVPSTIKYDNEDRTVAANSVKYYVGASKVSASEFETAYLNGEDAYVTVTHWKLKTVQKMKLVNQLIQKSSVMIIITPATSIRTGPSI